MKFKPKLIRRSDGGVEIHLSFSFSPDEVENIPKICDDPNVGFRELRTSGDQEQRVDHYLTYLRILCQWATFWNKRDQYGKYFHMWSAHRESQRTRMKRRRKK